MKKIDKQFKMNSVHEYIDTFYNPVRIHSHCSYLLLHNFEKQYAERKKAEKTLVG